MARLLLRFAFVPRVSHILTFIRSEAAGGVLLIGAGLLALVLSNSPARDAFQSVLGTHLGVTLGPWTFDESLDRWVNDALMALFFLLVGFEIRHEITEGQLSSPARLAGPAIAAAGGMIVPAVIYIAFNRHDPDALRGWAVPVATDIAFSLAVLQALGRRIPAGLKVFLTALAIIDDLGAIVVIAVFYSHGLAVGPLIAALALWAALLGLNRAGVRAVTPYILGGLVLWGLVAASGVHATLAGVALAFVVPMRERQDEAESPAHRMEHGLSSWVSLLVLPLFGLANAGLRFDTLPSGVLTDPLVLGLFLGLVAGKQVGVFASTWVAVQLRIARLPASLGWGSIYGAAALCGIGFTMSLFIGDLAFHGGTRDAEVKLAVFVGSVVSALFGLGILALSTKAVPSQRAKGVIPQADKARP